MLQNPRNNVVCSFDFLEHLFAILCRYILIWLHGGLVTACLRIFITLGSYKQNKCQMEMLRCRQKKKRSECSYTVFAHALLYQYLSPKEFPNTLGPGAKDKTRSPTFEPSTEVIRPPTNQSEVVFSTCPRLERPFHSRPLSPFTTVFRPSLRPPLPYFLGRLCLGGLYMLVVAASLCGRGVELVGWDVPRSRWKQRSRAGTMVSSAFRPLGRSQAQALTSAQGLGGEEPQMSP